MTDLEKHADGLGLQASIIKLFKEKGSRTDLWVREDVMAELSVDKRQAENALYNAWRSGKIYRHIDKDVDGQNRYALSIKGESQSPWIPSEKKQSTGPKRKKKQQLSPREVRLLFAATQTQLARLEDTVMSTIEAYEEMERAVNKFKSLL